MRRDQTYIGGSEGGFQETQWSDVLAAGTESTQHRQEANARIIGRYWKPVYCYLRRKGSNNEDAKDLTQGFFEEIVLGRDLVAQADPAKGRFRTFLLTALVRYASNIRRAQKARKRSPAGGMVSLEGFDSPANAVEAISVTPEQAFSYVWASGLLEEVINEVRVGCEEDRQGSHWQVFWERVIRPIREGSEARPLPELCAQHGIDDEKTASNMVVTVKRRFKKALRIRVRQLVSSDDEVDQEISDLMQILSTGGAAS
jgi:RNA polymerase sigma-70 factor (ECF subfamily)